MNHIEKYSDEELQEMQEYCIYMCNCFAKDAFVLAEEIHKIALVEINRELDIRKLRKENVLCK